MFKKNTTKKTYFKDSWLTDNIQIRLHLDQGIHKPDVVFLKLTLNWEI